jgi:hypothetical protein
MDELRYIRETIAKNGPTAQVEVVRWEKNPKTGFQDLPFVTTIAANIALIELQKPLNKRSRMWKMIRPVGLGPSGGFSFNSDLNSLSNPDLLKSIEDKVRIELEATIRAEMAAEAAQVEKPKKAKKVVDLSEIEPSEEIQPTEPTL